MTTLDWNTWLTHDADDLEVEQDMELTKVTVVQMRSVVMGKNENVRGDKSVEEVPYWLKNRYVVRGFQDLDALHGRKKTDAPTMPAEALLIMLHFAAQKGCNVVKGDVGSAFLSGEKFIREVYVRAPGSDLPKKDKTPAILPLLLMRLNKGVPSLNDGRVLALGFQKSNVAKSYYLYISAATGNLEAMLDTHIDDDLLVASKW